MSLNKKEIFQTQIFNPNDFLQVIQILKMHINERTCILLEGDLGSGKTTFTQKFCESYFLNDVSSPTFSLHQIYENNKIKINHFDLYRLKSEEDIETSGLWEVLGELKGLVFIEWSNRISEDDLPLDWNLFKIEINKKNEYQRLVILSRLFR